MNKRENINPGFKPSPLGPIPNDWEVKKLGNLGNLISGLTYSPDDICEENGVLVLRSSNVQEGQITFDDNVFVKVGEGEYNPVKRGDILICVRNGSKSLIGKCASINEKAEGMAFGAFMAVFRGSYNDYLIHVFNTDIYNREIYRNLGATINSINGSDLKLFIIPLPPLPEQQKIAAILSTWDQAISKTQQLIVQLKERNRGLQQKLLTGNKRLKGFNGKWEIKKLEDCMIYTPREVPKPSSSFFALGIRSHGKGIFHKNDFEPEDLAMDVLYEVKENDFIVNITFAWEQAVAIVGKQDNGGLVSHRFPTYTFNAQNAIPEYFRYFILQKYFKYQLDLISPGGAGRNRVMNKNDLLKIEVFIPEVDEQHAIADVLTKANTELHLIEQKLETLKQQKKGLMQQLLTGKKRVI